MASVEPGHRCAAEVERGHTRSAEVERGHTRSAEVERAHIRPAAAVALGWLVAGAWTATFGARCTFAALFHTPCPGCGMTRALQLLFAGRASDSVRMHPLALPALVAIAFLAAATTSAAYRRGSFAEVHRTRSGRLALAFTALVCAAAVTLWIARAFGAFGGPVPV